MKISELEGRLRKHAKITKSIMKIPSEMKPETENMEENVMNKKNISITKRILAISSVLIFCIITATLSPLGNSIKGIFKDIKRIDGAITGTQYENASNEIKAEVLSFSNDTDIPLELTFTNSSEVPFNCIEEIAIRDYKIIDSTTGEILKLVSHPEYSGKGTLKDGKASIKLSLNEIKFKSGEEYAIVIEKMYGLKKADAPLLITGTWKCNFVK